MRPEVLTLRVGQSVLTAVPSVHRSFPFAERVNELCADRSTRPDAIAVELSCHTAADVREWMIDLGIGPGERTDLPSMLALVRPRSSAAKGTNGAAETIELLCLTPSDSIIEAVRCGVELDLPVYGIDLDGNFRDRSATTMMEDPLAASGQAEEYARRNQVYSAERRDPPIDALREHTMASHLKYLLGRHERVLFVCGLAHWRPLQTLLLDARIPPALIDSAADLTRDLLQRVVVHPVVALSYMDRFPAIVEAYQQRRRHSGSSDEQPASASVIDATSIYARLMQATDVAHFVQTAPAPGATLDWEARADFESLLAHLCIVDQRRVPSAATILSAAEGTMSSAYRRQLAQVLLRYPWARPREDRFAGLPVLVPSGPRSGTRVVMVDARGRRGQDLAVESWYGEQGNPLDVNVPWDWVDEPAESTPPSDMVLNWPPIGRLVTALSLQAMERARTDANVPRLEVFAGGLRDGLALKPTLRAHAQGRDEWFVRDQVRHRRGAQRDPNAWDPVVWLFSLRPGPRAEWMVLAEELDEMIPLAERPDEMRAMQRERGTVVVEQIGFGTRTWAFRRPAAVRGGHSMYEWGGMLIYLPAHLSIGPTTHFVEHTRYRSTPIVSYEDPTSTRSQLLHDGHAVTQHFRDAYGMTLDLGDWPTTLIRMAIPFAQAAVTLVAPELYAVPGIARNEAARRGVTLRSVPHSAFPRETLSAAATWYGAKAIAGTLGREFPAATERLFGQPATANSHLLPPSWRE